MRTLLHFFLILLISFYNLKAQSGVIITYPKHRLGPYSAKNRFIEIKTDKKRITKNNCKCFFEGTNYYQFYNFSPKDNKVKGYKDTGKVIYASNKYKYELSGLYTGTYKGKSGLWAKFYGHYFTYFFLDDFKDVEKETLKKQKIITEKYKKANDIENEGGFGKILFTIIGFLLLLLIFMRNTEISVKSGSGLLAADAKERHDKEEEEERRRKEREQKQKLIDEIEREIRDLKDKQYYNELHPWEENRLQELERKIRFLY